MRSAALLIVLTVIAVAVGGCAGEAAEEERTPDDVATEFVDGLDESNIFFNIRADSAPESLYGAFGPCSSLSDAYDLLDAALTDDELAWVCCETHEFEAYAGDVSYNLGAVMIDAVPVGCVE